MGMAKLVFLGDKFAGRSYEFKVPTTTVGRGEHNTLTILDPSVSQTHCEILVWGDEVIVRDLNSTNGTYVDGERLQNQQRPVLAGQIVGFGLIDARLEIESASGTDTDTDVTAVHAYLRHLNDQGTEEELAKATTREIIPLGTSPEHTLVLRSPAGKAGGTGSAKAGGYRPRPHRSTQGLPARVILVCVVLAVFAVVMWLAARHQ